MSCVRTRSAAVVSVVLVLSAMSIAGSAPTSDGQDGVLTRAKQVFGPPLPQVISSDSNKVTPAKVKLGKMLFYEARTSKSGTISCSWCHPFDMYGADGLPKSMGEQCKPTSRNSPTVLNSAGEFVSHWTGSRKDVEDQAMQVLLGPSSQIADSVLRAIKGYLPLFQEAFPADKTPMTAENYGKAVGAFERTLVTPSPFDSYLKGNNKALTGDQVQGLSTFMDVGCTTCHSGTYVGGQMYQKFGVIEPYWNYTKSDPVDDGRYELTKQESDKYVFKVPVLRNVERTAPYFHDGSVSHLGDAVWIMGKVQLGKDLPKEQTASILSFLASLTGSIPEDALKIPVLPASD